MSLIQLFFFCMDNTIPTDLNIFLLPEAAAQLYSAGYLLFTILRRRLAVEKVMILLTPAVLLISYVMMDFFLGSSFRFGGFGKSAELLIMVETGGLSPEVVFLPLLFPLTWLTVEGTVQKKPYMGKYRIVERALRFFGILINGRLYLTCVFCALSLLRGHGIPEFWGYPKATMVTDYCYAIFCLLFQMVLHIAALILRKLFSERVLPGELREFTGDFVWCRRYMRAFFRESYALPLLGFGTVDLLLWFLPFFGEDGAKSLGEVFWFRLAVFLPVLLDFFVLFLLIRTLFPGMIPILRQRQDGDKIARLFCLEMLDETHPPEKGHAVWVSGNFILTPALIFRRAYYIPDYEKIRKNICYFHGGVKLKTQNLGADDKRLLRKALFGEQNHGWREALMAVKGQNTGE